MENLSRNDIESVIEQAKADVHGVYEEMQSIPVVKAAHEQRRLVEKLTMASLDAKGAYTNLVDADLWADKEQALAVQRLYKQAERLQEEIAALLREVQGE